MLAVLVLGVVLVVLVQENGREQTLNAVGLDGAL